MVSLDKKKKKRLKYVLKRCHSIYIDRELHISLSCGVNGVSDIGVFRTIHSMLITLNDTQSLSAKLVDDSPTHNILRTSIYE